MAISDKDLDYMKRVAEYYRSTVDPVTMPNGSFSETAQHFGITRTKVQKILVTTGDCVSELAEDIKTLRDGGMSIKEIAEKLKVSAATVSANTPYTSIIHDTLEPSGHTAAVREYRAYEKKQKDRQKSLKEEAKEKDWKAEWKSEVSMSYSPGISRPRRLTWDDYEKYYEPESAEMIRYQAEKRYEREKEYMSFLAETDSIPEEDLTEEQKETRKEAIEICGLYPGALDIRNRHILEELSGEKLPFEPHNVMRLHLELAPGYEDDQNILKTYGGVKRGNHITRDMVVPSNIPLYALHYAIQRAFGWQNSHLHMFALSDEGFDEFCENSTVNWKKMVGIVFRSPLMDQDDEFWADDYEGGSVKNWLRQKYTGPYLSMCSGEGLYSCMKDMESIRNDDVLYYYYAKMPWDENDPDSLTAFFKGWERYFKPEDEENREYEKVKFKDAPLHLLRQMFETAPYAVLERLPIEQVLCPGFDMLPPQAGDDKMSPEQKEEILFIRDTKCRNAMEELEMIQDDIDRVINLKMDSPFNQPHPEPFTTELYYYYDFGDGWTVKITGSSNCTDMVREGVIDQMTLDKANIKCRETYRPVLIARDGEMVMDDVGGIGGFVQFLETIYPETDGMDPDEKTSVLKEKREWLSWAKSQGWKKNEASNMNLM